jgi:pyrimidine operon attenuation protein/uracil phosphoribosyltransferase
MNLALIAVTTGGIKVAERIKENLRGEITVFLPQNLKQSKLTATYFSKKLVD